jgi:type I restriction enzyme M protein
MRWRMREGPVDSRRKRKANDRKYNVLIMDASKEFKNGRTQNELLPQHVGRIHGWYRAFRTWKASPVSSPLGEIAANDHNLNIPRYVEPKIEKETLSVEEAMKRLRNSAEAAFAEEERLVALLQNAGL